ncbi:MULTISPECIES: flagellar filament capping protein FliD [Paraburkholderia]|uniref:Flagellar hook-associated protein 2 n=1 Tax=Paraburkholderia podalyriae TaxID=1938811 RepID=A0ABR7PG83_9BURK|nr:flagellar filament capping protein FliD [Paraburkholderia podalyriae]MBC8745380.1 flagellar filament capping protein FliD [Paraburkholderia podalyriae]
MSTISGSSSSTSASAAAAAAQAAAAAALQQAGQSLIAGSTGNSTLDVQSLTTALVNAKVAGQAATLTAQAKNDNTQISAIGQLSSALSSLQISLAPLATGAFQSDFTATASGSGLTAHAGSGAVSGSYSIDVTQIAQAQSISSGAFTSTQAAGLGTGTLTIAVGDKSMSLNVTSSNNSLSSIAAAINGSSQNPGITATIVTGSDGSHLVLGSSTTGASSMINVTVSNLANDNGLSSLGVTSAAGTGASGASTITSAGTIAWNQTTAAQDAQFTINGTKATSSSNSVTSVLAGVTMNLGSTSVGTTQTLTVASDATSQISDVQSFVSSYNSLVSAMSSLSSFNSSASAGSQGGPLLGDSMLQTIRSTLGNLLGTSVSGSGVTASLSSIGISMNSDGTLSVDTSTLTSAVQNNPTQVGTLFNSTNGIAKQMNTDIATFTKTGGVIDIRTSALTADLKSVTTQSNSLTAYEALLTSQYSAQFTALNSLMATTNSNSQYLTQLFGGTNSEGALAKNAS